MRPKLFIVGGPKCGTTSLAHYLGEHPSVFMCDPKEPTFFNTDFTNRLTSSLEQYLRYFEHVDPQVKISGEASVLYLASQVAAANILEFEPEARFIAMLRNPIDMAHSLHSQNLRNGTEPLLDFAAAWHAQEHRARGEGVPAMCRDGRVLLYGFMCKLGEQVERLIHVAGVGRVHLVVFDDLRDDPRQTFCDVLRFLELDDDHRTNFPHLNENVAVRNMALKHAQRSMHEFKTRLGITRGLGLLKWLDRHNRTAKHREMLSPSLRAELAAYFRADVEKLGNIVGRPLADRWLRDA